MILDLEIINGCLVPANGHSQELFEGLKSNKWYKAKLTIPRNGKFHRKFFAMLKAVVEQSDFYTDTSYTLSIEELLERVKILTKHYTIMEISGMMVTKTKSISFEKMDERQFADFYDTALLEIRKDKQLNVPDLVLEGF